MRSFYTYIIQCSDNTYYIGITSNLDGRLYAHQVGLNTDCYTFTRRPLSLVYYEEYQYVEDAIRREKQLKGWSKKKKIALINNRIEELQELSRCSPKKN